jgi:PEP-CTERM motif
MKRNTTGNLYRCGTPILALLICLTANPAWASGPIGQEFVIEPDSYAHTQVLNTVSPHVTLSTGAFSDNRPTFDVVAYTDAADASTGTKVFAQSGGIPFWNISRTFRMDFHSLVTNIQIDYIGSGFLGNSYRGRLEAYSSAGVLVDSYLTAPLAGGQFETMVVDAPQIAWALAYPPEDPFGDLDNLRFTVVPEPATLALIGLAMCGGQFVRRRTRNKWQFGG